MTNNAGARGGVCRTERVAEFEEAAEEEGGRIAGPTKPMGS